MMNKIIFFLMAMIITASAEQGTEKDIEYRQNLFKSIKAQTQNIGMVLKNQAGEKSDLKELASALHAQSKLVAGAFQKKTATLDADTKANHKIWDDFTAFQLEADKFVNVTKEFYKKTQENEKISLKDFKSVIGSCKSCHKNYKD